MAASVRPLPFVVFLPQRLTLDLTLNHNKEQNVPHSERRTKIQNVLVEASVPEAVIKCSFIESPEIRDFLFVNSSFFFLDLCKYNFSFFGIQFLGFFYRHVFSLMLGLGCSFFRPQVSPSGKTFGFGLSSGLKCSD